jgi:hypothetical protein
LNLLHQFQPVLEDYSEPFDARKNGIPLTPRSPNNDEYTEPYDAQQMLKGTCTGMLKNSRAYDEYCFNDKSKWVVGRLCD